MDEGRALDLLRRAVHEVDPDLATFGEGSLSGLLALPLFPMRVAAASLMLFGLLAVVLVTIGTYGLVSYSIARRTRELCIRLAIGASAGHIVRIILGRIAVIGLGGAAVGAAAALAGAPLIAPLLLEVRPRDPIVLSGAVGILGMVTALATWLPTRRALRSDPATLLRDR
jgi:ABC-type antimicrobial peptide transport system permease subunit